MRIKIIAATLIAPLLIGCGSPIAIDERLEVSTNITNQNNEYHGYILYKNAEHSAWFIINDINDLNKFESATTKAIGDVRKQMEK